MSTIELFEAMSSLRAVRRLRPDPIPEATIRRLIEAAIPIGLPVRTGHGPISRRPPEKLAFADTWGEPIFREGAP